MHYLATVIKFRVQKSRVLFSDFIKILILLRIRALLVHSFQDRILRTRVSRGHLWIYMSPKIHWTRALLCHNSYGQSPKSSRIIWPHYKNSYTPKNSRITCHYFQDRFLRTRVLRGHLATHIRPEVHWTRSVFSYLTECQIPDISRIIRPLYKNSYIPKYSRITWPLFSEQN